VRNTLTAAGIRAGPGTLVLGNTVTGNAVMGISAYKAHRAQIIGNTVTGNATTADASAATATRAGMKIVGADSVLVKGNIVRDNGGAGIWFDIGGRGALVDSNTVTGNRGSGIWLEITYGGRVTRNTVERNGTAPGWLDQAGIQVTNSPDVEVAGNTVLDNANGITAMQASGYPADVEGRGSLVVQNLWVHNNVVRMSVGQTGLAQNVGDASYFTGRGNRFQGNAYTLGTRTGYFAWADRTQLTESQWTNYGQD
jgi:parallel beta-helix repeat protein